MKMIQIQIIINSKIRVTRKKISWLDFQMFVRLYKFPEVKVGGGMNGQGQDFVYRKFLSLCWQFVHSAHSFSLAVTRVTKPPSQSLNFKTQKRIKADTSVLTGSFSRAFPKVALVLSRTRVRTHALFCGDCLSRPRPVLRL